VQEHRHALIAGELLTSEAWHELFNFGVLPNYDRDRPALEAMATVIADKYEAKHTPINLDGTVSELEELLVANPEHDLTIRAVLQFAKEKNLTFHAREAAGVRSRALIEDCCREFLTAYSEKYGCGDLIEAFNERAATVKNSPYDLRKLACRHDVA
jgi:hypothetical protein